MLIEFGFLFVGLTRHGFSRKKGLFGLLRHFQALTQNHMRGSGGHGRFGERLNATWRSLQFFGKRAGEVFEFGIFKGGEQLVGLRGQLQGALGELCVNLLERLGIKLVNLLVHQLGCAGVDAGLRGMLGQNPAAHAVNGGNPRAVNFEGVLVQPMLAQLLAHAV